MAISYIPQPRSLMMRDDRRKLSLKGGKRLSIFPFWEYRTAYHPWSSSVSFGGYYRSSSGVSIEPYVYPWESPKTPDPFVSLVDLEPIIYQLVREEYESPEDFRDRVAAVEVQYKDQGLFPDDKQFLVGDDNALLTIYNGCDEVLSGSFVTSCSREEYPGERIYIQSQPNFPTVGHDIETGEQCGCPDLFIEHTDGVAWKDRVMSYFTARANYFSIKGVGVWSMYGDNSDMRIRPVKKSDYTGDPRREYTNAFQLCYFVYSISPNPPYAVDDIEGNRVSISTRIPTEGDYCKEGGFSNIAGSPAQVITY